MASNYNKLPRPAVVFVSDGRARTVVRRETEEDLLRLDVDEPAGPVVPSATVRSGAGAAQCVGTA